MGPEAQGIREMHAAWITAAFVIAGLVASAGAQELPAQFDHDRIRLSVKAPDQSTLRFYTDSGGGWNAITKTASDRLKLRTVGQVEVDEEKVGVVDFPVWLVRAGLPRPLPEPWFKGRLVVAPDKALRGDDGFLGSRWFAGGVWRIDYPAQSFSRLPAKAPATEGHPAKLGFRHGKNGKRDLHFARIEISVDSKPINVLLDTGATATLTEASAAAFQVKPGTQIGTSYIAKSIFDQWRAAHPSWRVIEEADHLSSHAFPMIEVPEVSMAGVTFGPVWFTQRSDAEFREGVSRMMDQPIHGAIGGSGLKYLRIVLDYPRAIAHVQKP